MNFFRFGNKILNLILGVVIIIILGDSWLNIILGIELRLFGLRCFILKKNKYNGIYEIFIKNFFSICII